MQPDLNRLVERAMLDPRRHLARCRQRCAVPAPTNRRRARESLRRAAEVTKVAWAQTFGPDAKPPLRETWA